MILTHGHGDHVADVEIIASNNPDMLLISNFEIVSYYAEKGIKGHGMNLGGKQAFDFGTVKLVNAVHSSVLPDGTYAGNPVGVVIWNNEGCIYHAGDTAVTKDMELIPMICPELDVAILPIGDNFTMCHEDACLASDLFKCDHIIGCHFDTFEVIEIDRKKVRRFFEDKNKQLILPEIGQMIDV
jgi:L-ascorbate metabolism protein UlaG (beta-lactamase superfamily)